MIYEKGRILSRVKRLGVGLVSFKVCKTAMHGQRHAREQRVGQQKWPLCSRMGEWPNWPLDLLGLVAWFVCGGRLGLTTCLLGLVRLVTGCLGPPSGPTKTENGPWVLNWIMDLEPE